MKESLYAKRKERKEVYDKMEVLMQGVQHISGENIQDTLNENIKVFCKTKGISLNERYSGTDYKIVRGHSLVSALTDLTNGLAIDTDNLTDHRILSDFDSKGKSLEDIIADLSSVTGFDYYFKDNVIYFEDKKSIGKDDEPVIRFSGIKDIESLDTSTNKESRKVNKVIINPHDGRTADNKPLRTSKTITASNKITLNMTNSPQACSSESVKTYADDEGNKYKVSPVMSTYEILYAPHTTSPNVSFSVSNKSKEDDGTYVIQQPTTGTKKIIEKYQMDHESILEVSAGIVDNLVVRVDGQEPQYNYSFGYNIIHFGSPQTGSVDVSYDTSTLTGTIPAHRYPLDLDINITLLDQIIKYKHKLVLKEYAPVPYTFKINLISVWGISSDEATDADVDISKLKNNDFSTNEYESWGSESSDSFGEIYPKFTDYGTYKLEMSGQENLYLDYYINKHQFYTCEKANV